MKKYGNLKDIVGIQICQVKRVKIEKTTEERRNISVVTAEGNRAHCNIEVSKCYQSDLSTQQLRVVVDLQPYRVVVDLQITKISIGESKTCYIYVTQARSAQQLTS
ncbi:hypothetical protein ACJX0J_030844, partial [Zea mays]